MSLEPIDAQQETQKSCKFLHFLLASCQNYIHSPSFLLSALLLSNNRKSKQTVEEKLLLNDSAWFSKPEIRSAAMHLLALFFALKMPEQPLTSKVLRGFPNSPKKSYLKTT